MAIKFSGPTRHGHHTFAPTIALAFDDEDAETYFVKAGFAEATNDEPVMTYPAGSVEIDPETVFGDGPNRGKLVIGGE